MQIFKLVVKVVCYPLRTPPLSLPSLAYVPWSFVLCDRYHYEYLRLKDGFSCHAVGNFCSNIFSLKCDRLDIILNSQQEYLNYLPI